jgi:hypothetical protein
LNEQKFWAVEDSVKNSARQIIKSGENIPTMGEKATTIDSFVASLRTNIKLQLFSYLVIFLFDGGD